MNHKMKGCFIMSENSAKKIQFKGVEAVELRFGRYHAIVLPSLGSNVIRFRDEEKHMEIFRYSDELTISDFMKAPEIWGLPTLYLPNRFDGGIIRTSDALYNLPVNEERFKNHLHGFLHKRVHKVKDIYTDSNHSYVTTTYTYDENDFFFNCFPIKFTAEITIDLSSDGLKHTIKLTNNSENKKMPVSIATHTTINAPFVDNGKLENIRLQVPAEKKLQFNKKRWLPNGRMLNLNNYDKEYVNGTKCPVLSDICNDMYTGGKTALDGKNFHGCVMTDIESGKRICYEVDDGYKFWIIWNDRGFKNYFCPEPMTAQVNAPNLEISPDRSGYIELAKNETFSVSQRFFTI